MFQSLKDEWVTTADAAVVVVMKLLVRFFFFFKTKWSLSFHGPRHRRTTPFTSLPPLRHSSLSPSCKFAASLRNSHSFFVFNNIPKTVQLGGGRRWENKFTEGHVWKALNTTPSSKEFNPSHPPTTTSSPTSSHLLVCILLRQLFSLWVPRGCKDDYKQSSFECS